MFLVNFWFFVFMAVTIAVYYLTPGRMQWMVLLAASLVFYLLAGEPATILWLLVSIVTVWTGTNAIEKYRGEPKKAKRILIAVLVMNVGILAALKYTNFLISNVKLVCGLFGGGEGISPVHWAASLGVSFYTLQMVSYLLDVYWETSRAQKNPGKVALFASWFPQMSSGPICRYHEIGEQLYAPHRFDWESVCFGLQRMLFGLIKKLVIAENLAPYVNAVLNAQAAYSGWFLLGGIFWYVVQLYADFSGCMDIVLGASQCFGVRMPENFDRPFHSRSLQEFWQRWHMTLGLWAKDYIMYPLLHSKLWGSMRKKLKKKYGKWASKNIPTWAAMMVLWLYIGIWHGGGWNYIGEGLWFGGVIILGQLLEKQLKAVKRFFHINTESALWHGFQSARTAVLYAVGAVFFRAESVGQALGWLKAAVSPGGLKLSGFLMQLEAFKEVFRASEVYKSAACIAAGCVLTAVLLLFQRKGKSFYQWLSERPLPLRWGILYVMLFTVILFGVYGPEYNASQFIYGGF